MDSKSLAARIQDEIGSTESRESAPQPGPPPPVADHELVRRIGAGSYGEVWLARSVTGQWRAVKVITRAGFTSERPYEREFRGALQFEPISRSHAGLMQVLHVGRDEAGESFHYVMELADPMDTEASAGSTRETESPSKPAGNSACGPVARWCRKEPRPTEPSGYPIPPTRLVVPLPPFSPAEYRPRTLASDLKSRGRLSVSEVVALGVQLTGALGHIHRHGLVHRDVKPSNVIFVQGQPKLADLGLVAMAKEARSFVGTEGFIPPEGPGSPKADLFALGRLLYEAATGKDRCEFPELPEDLDTAPDREEMLELNEVLSRLCAPDPAQRYANAAEVAGDLNLILAGHSVRRANGVERRLRLATQAGVAALGVLALAAGVVWFQGMRRREAETRAVHEQSLRTRAESAEHESRRQLYTALLEQARANRLSHELGQRVRTLDAVRRAAAITNTAGLRGEAFAALGKPDLRWARDIPIAPDERQSFDPAFERFAITRNRGPIEIRSTADRRLLATLPAATNLYAYVMEWSADGRFLAVKRDYPPGGERADLEVWEVAAARRVLLARSELSRNALAFNPREPEIMAANENGHMTVWHRETGRPLRSFSIEGLPLMLRVAPDGRRFAMPTYAAGKYRVAVCDTQTGAVLSSYADGTVAIVEWHPQGRWLALLETDGQVRLLDPESGSTSTLGRHKAQAVGAAFSPDGNFLITGGWEAELICWDLRARERAFTIGLNSWTPRFRQDGRQCAITLRDRVAIYDFQSPDCLRELAIAADQRVARGAFSQNGRWMAVGRDNGFAVWDLENAGPAAVVANDCRRLVFDPNSSEAFAFKNQALTRWRLIPGSPGAPPALENLPVFVPPRFCTASLRDRELVLTSFDGVRFLALTNAEAGPPRHLKKADGWSGVSPDGRWLAARHQSSPLLRLYQLPEVEEVVRLTNRSDVWTFAFSPNGNELAVATRNGLEVYETTTWQRVRELTVASERQSEIIYTPDGSAFWYTSDGRTSALRDSRTLEVLLPLPAGTLPLALSPDGQRLAVSLDTRRVQLWDLTRVREQFRELGVDWAAR